MIKPLILGYLTVCVFFYLILALGSRLVDKKLSVVMGLGMSLIWPLVMIDIIRNADKEEQDFS